MQEEEDEELVALATDEAEELRGQQQRLEQELRVLLIPKDPDDGRNAIVEIRAGTGGDEAGLFCRRSAPALQPFCRAEQLEDRIIVFEY